MLKISQAEPANHAVTLRLEGRVIGPWVWELRKACERLLASGQALALDLGEVDFVDRNGVGLFLSLKSRGVSLVECSPFLAEELKAGENSPGQPSG
jgi:anti-anti-sigma regulatory factor